MARDGGKRVAAAVDGAPATKVCMNPRCGKPFTPGHYGQLQKVCSGSQMVDCKKCKGKDCRRCAGKGRYKESCKIWYRNFWSQTRKRPRSIPDADFTKLLKTEPDVFWRTYMVVARESGLRKGEMLGLVWNDVLDGNLSVKSSTIIRGQWSDTKGFCPTKTDSGKVGYILDQSRAALGGFLKTVQKEGPWGNRRIWEVTEAATWTWFTSLQARVGVSNPDTGRPYRVHDLRHTAALRAYQATGDIRKAQVLLSHKSLSSTSIYTQVRPEEFAAGLEEAFKKKRS